jgi:hypothetical protein
MKRLPIPASGNSSEICAGVSMRIRSAASSSIAKNFLLFAGITALPHLVSQLFCGEACDWRHAALLERSHRCFRILENLEQFQQADHLQGSDGKLRRVQELQRSAALLGIGQVHDEQADAAGIEHRNLFQIEYVLVCPRACQVIESAAQAVYGVPEREPAGELDHLYIPPISNLDFQV